MAVVKLLAVVELLDVVRLLAEDVAVGRSNLLKSQ
jgi:hypothetical protein